MHLKNKTAAIMISCFTLALVFLAPALMHGDEWNLTTRFTVNQPFEVPGMVLQPNTRYVIRLLDSPASRNVVQIYTENQMKLLATFMGISDERMETTDHTVFTFIETEPGFPLPIKEWFYPGRLSGLEFVYPKTQAMEIAQHAKQPILSASGSDLHDLKSIEVEAIKPGKEATPATVAQTAAITKSEETPPVTEEKPGVADNTPKEPPIDQDQSVEPENLDHSQPAAQNDSNLKSEPEIQREKPAEPPAAAEPPAPAEPPAVKEESKSNKEELPGTAGELPLVALIGALCLGAGLGLKVLSAKS